MASTKINLLKYGNLTVYRNTEIKTIYYIHSIPILSEIFSAGKPAGKEWNGERSSMAQHAILRFEKHKGHPAGPLEATMNGKRSSTPATRTLTPAGASTISTSSSRMAATTISFRAASSRQMPHPQGQHSVCGHADYRQPEFSRASPQRR